MRAVLLVVAVAAAAVALIVNVALFDRATTKNDRVGRLDPNYALIRPTPVPATPVREHSRRELPDD